jgi:hypothetical protein
MGVTEEELVEMPWETRTSSFGTSPYYLTYLPEYY